MTRGLISEIQRGSVHDGPGLRTVVFMKGCNMRCSWCHNPETVYGGEEILTAPDRCIGCGACDKGCFSGAKITCGTYLEPEQVLEVIEEDRPYYEGTGKQGGVTISGGEPLCQSAFTSELLRLCRKCGIHTALETNLSLDTETVLSVCSQTDYIMCDCKLYDEARHKIYTGKSNQIILQNLLELDCLNIPILVRTPVIRGVNDEEGQIMKIAGHLQKIKNLIGYELLTYHPLGLGKPVSGYFTPARFEKPSETAMQDLADCAGRSGIPVFINGVLVKGKLDGYVDV